MFLSKQALEIERKKQACLLRTELNRRTLALMLDRTSRPGEKALSLGLMAADLIYGLWKSKKRNE